MRTEGTFSPQRTHKQDLASLRGATYRVLGCVALVGIWGATLTGVVSPPPQQLRPSCATPAQALQGSSLSGPDCRTGPCRPLAAATAVPPTTEDGDLPAEPVAIPPVDALRQLSRQGQEGAKRREEQLLAAKVFQLEKHIVDCLYVAARQEGEVVFVSGGYAWSKNWPPTEEDRQRIHDEYSDDRHHTILDRVATDLREQGYRVSFRSISSRERYNRTWLVIHWGE